MRQAGRYLPEYRAIRATRPFLEVCKTPDLAAEVSLQPFRILGVDAIIVFSDILIPAEAMGMHLELNDAGPNLPSPIRSAADVANLRIFDPEVETKFLPEAIRRIVKSVGPEVPVLGFAAAPWTLACYMVEGKTKEGFSTVKSFLYHEPETFRHLLSKIAQATIPYLNAQIDAGASAVQLFDTWCGELNLGRLRKFRAARRSTGYLRHLWQSSGHLLHQGFQSPDVSGSPLRSHRTERRLACRSRRPAKNSRPQNRSAGQRRSRRFARAHRQNPRSYAKRPFGIERNRPHP